MNKWSQKEGYETCLLADEKDLDNPESEIQLVRFRTGKHHHYHKRKTEFFYFTRGNGKIIIGDTEKQLTSGSSLVIKPNTNHTFINETEEPLEAIMLKTNNRPDDTFS